MKWTCASKHVWRLLVCTLCLVFEERSRTKNITLLIVFIINGRKWEARTKDRSDAYWGLSVARHVTDTDPDIAVMHQLMMGIPSEKCNVKQFQSCALCECYIEYLYKTTPQSLPHPEAVGSDHCHIGTLSWKCFHVAHVWIVNSHISLLSSMRPRFCLFPVLVTVCQLVCGPYIMAGENKQITTWH